jgi:lipopolysaccharide transport system ATP-binding protein
MSQPAIVVRELGKAYRVGSMHKKKDTFIGEAIRWVQYPLENLRRLRNQRIDSTIEDPDVIWALRDVNLEVPEGQVLGIIGKNGAGKSTLLKILSRITEPTTGRAQIHGRVASLLEVGTGFHPDLTGKENAYLNGTMLGMKKAEIDRHLDSIVEFSGVERFMETPVKRYSSGMRVRLAFAVAAHLEPEILLVDEVLAVGDASFQAKCMGKMHELAGGGRTVLFVSHNLAAVSQLCDRVVWLENGGVAGDGAPLDIIRDYLKLNLETMPSRTWPVLEEAPGDDKVRLVKADIVQDAVTQEVIDINRPFQIEIGFVILKPSDNLVTGVNLYDSNGQCLFTHCDWRDNFLVPGRYAKNVTIPAQTLAEGDHSILLQLVYYDPQVNSVVLPEALKFRGVDSSHADAVRGKYKGGWPGVVRLKLDWSDARELRN